jgi:hypothetical protein
MACARCCLTCLHLPQLSDTAGVKFCTLHSPGTYQTQPRWVQQQQQTSWHTTGGPPAPSHTPSAALIGCPVRIPDPAPPAAAAAYSRKGASTHTELLLSTPPSIPARHQSFGYEPGPDGGLVMQAPPAQPREPAGKMAGKASSFNSSRSRSPARPSTVPDQRRPFAASASAAAGRSSSARYGASPMREPTRQLQQQLRAVQEPAGHAQQLAGCSSPR